MAKKRKTTPVSTDASPSDGNVTTQETIVQGSPVTEGLSEKVEQTMTEVAGARPEKISLPHGHIPRNANRADAEEEKPAVVQGGSLGKPGLPEPEAEPEYDLPDEIDMEEEGEEVTSFSDKDRQDLTLLEKKIDSNTREQAEALREIRRRQLWRLERDDQGSQPYANFEAYCQDRWDHSRQWVTHLTNWLQVVEEGERLGITTHLTVKAAQGLLIGRLPEAGGLRAVLEEAKEDGVPLDRDHLRQIVLRRADFNYWSKEGKAGSTKPAAKTYGKYKQDLATVKELASASCDNSVVGNARQLDGDFPENLVGLCQKERVLPTPDQLLAVLTGRELEEVVSRLKDLAKEHAEIEEKKTRRDALRKEIKTMETDGGLKKAKEEARKLEKDLEAKGILKRKKKEAPQQEQAPGGGPPTIPMASGERRNETDDEEPDEDERSEVRQNLALALDNLAEALTGDWPDDRDELNAILTIAHKCELTLAEIFEKGKELVVDAKKPEGVHADALDLLRTMPSEILDKAKEPEGTANGKD